MAEMNKLKCSLTLGLNQIKETLMGKPLYIMLQEKDKHQQLSFY
jgi:hypothetical protein